MKQQEIIKKFKGKTGYTLGYNDGKFSYGGSLYLEGTQIQSLPDNLTVWGDLYLRGTQADQKKFIGNAVEVNMARVLCEAIVKKLVELKKNAA